MLDYDDVVARFDAMIDWLAETYVDALNVIHYMHDKYAYERLEMALHDYARPAHDGVRHRRPVGRRRLPRRRSSTRRSGRSATRRAWSSTTAIEGEFPTYGNDDDRVDEIAVELVRTFMEKVRQHPTYRDAVHTQSVLTITSNVVYGKHTGNTPDGRPRRRAVRARRQPDERPRPARPGRRRAVGREAPLRGRRGRHLADRRPSRPAALGRTAEERIDNLVGILDGYVAGGGFHMNVNVLDRETLLGRDGAPGAATRS